MAKSNDLFTTIAREELGVATLEPRNPGKKISQIKRCRPLVHIGASLNSRDHIFNGFP